jgi:hypothetical protein
MQKLSCCCGANPFFTGAKTSKQLERKKNIIIGNRKFSTVFGTIFANSSKMIRPTGKLRRFS